MGSRKKWTARNIVLGYFQARGSFNWCQIRASFPGHASISHGFIVRLTKYRYDNAWVKASVFFSSTVFLVVPAVRANEQADRQFIFQALITHSTSMNPFLI